MPLSLHEADGSCGRVQGVKPLPSGIVVGVLVFLLLLFTFASGTGSGELLLWALIAFAAGATTTALLRRSSSQP